MKPKGLSFTNVKSLPRTCCGGLSPLPIVYLERSERPDRLVPLRGALPQPQVYPERIRRAHHAQHESGSRACRQKFIPCDSAGPKNASPKSHLLFSLVAFVLRRAFLGIFVSQILKFFMPLFVLNSCSYSLSTKFFS